MAANAPAPVAPREVLALDLAWLGRCAINGPASLRQAQRICRDQASGLVSHAWLSAAVRCKILRACACACACTCACGVRGSVAPSQGRAATRARRAPGSGTWLGLAAGPHARRSARATPGACRRARARGR